MHVCSQLKRVFMQIFRPKIQNSLGLRMRYFLKKIFKYQVLNTQLYANVGLRRFFANSTRENTQKIKSIKFFLRTGPETTKPQKYAGGVLNCT